MNAQRGAIVLVPFPFTDLTQQKPRPAVVVSSERFNRQSDDAILVALSSNTKRPLADTDFVIWADDEDFAGTGLRLSSVVRCGKLVTMHQSLILTKLGTMNDQRMTNILSLVTKALGLN
ncbi:MAG: type II toxin-antitoxin system PemK/MazF family toxin [Chloroflexi bacterium]|nr:type II toxin-antitoxin system PemK/MazF family toxin [Chloroflexota bacterium]